jgi:hypothetical protein
LPTVLREERNLTMAQRAKCQGLGRGREEPREANHRGAGGAS